MSDTYVKQYCPHCKTRNLVWLGTWKCSTEAGECHSCGHCFLFGDESEHREQLYEILLAHYNLVDENEDLDDDAYAKIRDALLNGGYIEDGGKKLYLSDFLKEYAMIERGEPCQ